MVFNVLSGKNTLQFATVALSDTHQRGQNVLVFHEGN